MNPRGADPSIPNKNNTTPLMVASGIGYIEGQVRGSKAEALAAVELLVERGQSVITTNDNDETALHGAVYRGASAIVLFLVERGDKLDAKDDEDLMPVQVADGFRRGGGFRTPHEDTAALLMGPAPRRSWSAT